MQPRFRSLHRMFSRLGSFGDVTTWGLLPKVVTLEKVITLGWVFGLMMMNHASAQTNLSQKPIFIGAGDVIALSSRAHKALNRKWVVSRQGRIRLPLVGYLTIQGMTPRSATRFVIRRLSSYYQGISRLRVVLVKRKKFVWVKGWVQNPGVFHVGWRESVDTLLRLAKARPGARLDRIWIRSRQGQGQTARSFNLLKYYTSKGKTQLPLVPRNCEIFVEAGGAREFSTNKSSISVVGAVKRTGVFPCLKALTLLQVLALAGGPLPKAGLREILITSPKGRVRWFDLHTHLQGKNLTYPLPMVHPGSVVFVPYEPLGTSQRGPIRILGRVAKPGIWRGVPTHNLATLLAGSGGPRADADLTSVRVVVQGKNFTISQKINATRALAQGRMDRLPPPTQNAVIVYVPSRTNFALRDVQGWLQVGVAVASIVTSVVLVVTLTR